MRKIKKDSKDVAMYQEIFEAYSESGITEARAVYRTWKSCTAKQAKEDVTELFNWLKEQGIDKGIGQDAIHASMAAIILTDEEVAKQDMARAKEETRYIWNKANSDIREIKVAVRKEAEHIKRDMEELIARIDISLDSPTDYIYTSHTFSRARDLEEMIVRLKDKVNARQDLVFMFRDIEKITGFIILEEEVE